MKADHVSCRMTNSKTRTTMIEAALVLLLGWAILRGGISG
jgi:hypothetical protein